MQCYHAASRYCPVLVLTVDNDVAEDWLARWEEGRIGWHEARGNAALREFWPKVALRSRVLVPLCGKTSDLLWLANRGHEVVGVELSEIAVRAFFAESGLPFEVTERRGLQFFRCRNPDVTVVCGDYFKFTERPFDALFDRASLVALPPEARPDYVRHTRSLLRENAAKLLVTLEYDQAKVAGPPYSVLPDELTAYWTDVRRISSRNDIDGSPPKFRDAGLTEVIEAVWETR